MNRRQLLLSASAASASLMASSTGVASAQRRLSPTLAPGVYVQERARLTGTPPRALDTTVFVGALSSDLPSGTVQALDTPSELDPRFDLAAAAIAPYSSQGGGRCLLVQAAPDASGRPDYMRALDALDATDAGDFTLLHLVDAGRHLADDPAARSGLYARGLRSARSNYATLVIDAPDSHPDYALWRRELAIDDPDAIAYAPWLRGQTGALIPPGPAVMGQIMAMTRTEGVWKAPAGMSVALLGYSARALTQAEIGAMTAAHVNPVWTRPTNGTLIWGARTLSTDPEYRYIPVRRRARWIEGSLPRLLDWVEAEPNVPVLWQAIRAQLGDFLNGLYREGAFMGTTPSQSYFVQCGLGSTMTQTDLDQGRVRVQLGFAPLRPAEFIVLDSEIMLDQP